MNLNFSEVEAFAFTISDKCSKWLMKAGRATPQKKVDVN